MATCELCALISTGLDRWCSLIVQGASATMSAVEETSRLIGKIKRNVRAAGKKKHFGSLSDGLGRNAGVFSKNSRLGLLTAAGNNLSVTSHIVVPRLHGTWASLYRCDKRPKSIRPEFFVTGSAS